MKNRYLKWMFVFLAGYILPSCYDEFDPTSYAPPFTINGFSSVSQIKQANLVGYWAFEESYVDSISGTVGTGVGTTFVNGFKGKGMKGAIDGYVISDLPSEIATMHSFTVSFWINTPLNPEGISSPVTITREDDFWGNLDIFYENGATEASTIFKTHVNNNGAGAWSETTISNPWNAWMNVTITYNETTSDIVTYVNGSSIKTFHQANFGPLTFQNANKIIFGTNQFQTTPDIGTAGGPQDWASFLIGILDEVRIYNAALTASEVNSMVILQGKGK